MEEWVEGLSVFIRGDLREKAYCKCYCLLYFKVAFSVYDLNADAIISRDEIFQLLSLSLSNRADIEDQEDIIRDLVEYTFKRLDCNHDGKVTFNDYFNAVKEEILLAEILGQCLPTDTALAAFLATFEEPQARTITRNPT
ncbi:unnamed protein product [Mesocestoides corti]|uniref:EF-hand domain-containing protein n=1 Tax=Mesocestoides corti TaxID=53468 RepID=A0A0R3UIN7_MESCO|nr:unnamed protein product [Mesocestoides corti]